MAILKPINRDSLKARTVAITPYELYSQLVSSCTNNMRATALGYTFYPAQFGGILGQGAALRENCCLQVVDFSVSGENQNV